MKKEYRDGTVFIGLDSKLDYDGANIAEEEITAWLDETEKTDVIRSAVIDAASLEYLSSNGMRMLIGIKKRIKNTKIINVSETVYEVFAITGTEIIFGLEKAAVKPGSEPMAGKRPPSTWRQQEADIPLTGINDTHVPFVFRPVTAMFEDQVGEHRDDIAVVSSRGSMTYGELNENANRIANQLIYMGIKTGDHVLIMLDRGIEIYAATIGVLKSGASYTIVNIKYPDERIEYICKDAGCGYIISTRDIVYDRLELFVDKLQKRPVFYEDCLSWPETENPEVDIHPEDLCYLIYTSGSTGKPKGVMISHGNLSSFLLDDPKNTLFRGLVYKGSCFLAMAQMTFDVSVKEEYIPLVSGKKITYALYDEISNPGRLADLMIEHKVDAAVFTPSYLTGLLKHPRAAEAVKDLKTINVGAEPFPAILYTRLTDINPDIHIMNSYGPTETTVSCMVKVMKSADKVTIGRPFPNVYVFVADENNNEVPRMEPGELIICGDGVGEGYINLPEKTKESYITFHGMKAYKSGDLVRLTEDDEIEYIARKDNQVKIRGLRIELEEVEAIMGRMPGIDRCAGAAIKGRHLCLYYTVNKPVTEAEVREYAKAHLAHYMIPDIYMQLDLMPTSQNFKIDRKSLPEPPEHALSDDVPEAPETEEQERLLSLLGEAMEEGEYGINTNLIEAGMSSLDMMVYISLIGESFDVVMGMRDLNDHPTVKELAEFIKTAPKIKRRRKKDRYPATVLQTVDYMATVNGETDLMIPMLYEFEMSVDDERLKEAIYTAMENHPGLGMYLEADEDGKIWQVPGDKARAYEIKTVHMEDAELDADMSSLSRAIPPDAKYLFRYEIINTDTRKFLLADYSHLNSDGMSVEIMIRDIAAAYEGKQLRPEFCTMFELGDMMSGFWETAPGKRCIGIYEAMLSQDSGPVTLPPDREPGSWKPGRFEAPLSVSAKAIAEYCRKNRLSISDVLTGVVGLVLAGYTGRDNVSFGYGFSGRNDSRLGNTYGYIASLLEVCCRTKNHKTAADYLESVYNSLMNLMVFPGMPIEQLAGKYPNLIDVLFLFQPKRVLTHKMDNTVVKTHPLQEMMPNKSVKLIIQAIEGEDDEISLVADYHENLYTGDYIGRFISDINKAVRDIVEGKAVNIEDISVS